VLSGPAVRRKPQATFSDDPLEDFDDEEEDEDSDFDSVLASLLVSVFASSFLAGSLGADVVVALELLRLSVR
jgi:hypothetical protein